MGTTVAYPFYCKVGILVSQLGLDLIPALIVVLVLRQNDEDDMIIDCCLVCNSRINNNNNDVILQNSSMYRFGDLEASLS